MSRSRGAIPDTHGHIPSVAGKRSEPAIGTMFDRPHESEKTPCLLTMSAALAALALISSRCRS